jgi:pilus assembly protein Flp/PilA
MSKFAAFLKNESGATAIEYALIASGISIAIVAAVYSLGSQLTAKYQGVSTAFQ